MRALMRVLVSLSVVAAFTLSVARPTNAQHPLDGTSQVIQIGGTGAKVYSQGSSDGDYPPNWTAPQFPDSTWNPPSQVSQTSSGCNGSLIGWQTPGYYGSNQNNYYLFRQTFTLNQALDYYGSILNLGATNGVLGDIYVNGTEVTSRYDAPSNGFARIAIGQYLQTGLNVIAFSLKPSTSCNAATFAATIVNHTGPASGPPPAPLSGSTPTVQIGGGSAKVLEQGSYSPDSSAYPSSWTNTQFDDSAWASAFQTSQSVQSCASNAIQGWGNAPSYYGSNQSGYYLFRQTFQLPAGNNDYYGSILNLGATSGVLGDIYVNGTEVTSRYDAPSGSFSQIAIGQYLQAGLNVIAFSLNPSAYDSANNPCNAVTFTANLVVYPAPTDTPTATDTPTDTPTATDIPTSTNTPTNTPTASPTATNTPTNTSTPVPPPATATLVPPPTTATSAAPPATARPVPPPATSAPAPPPATATSAPPSPVFVAVPTETRTPTRHSNRRIQGPALIIRALPKSVASGSKLAIILHTASRAQVTLTVRVTTLKTVYTGKPKHRKRVTHTLVLYSAVLKGKADKQGLFKGELPIIYKSAKPVSAQLSVSVHTTNGTTTRNTPVTILPQQHQKYRKP